MLDPIVFAFKALNPTPVLCTPVVFEVNAPEPNAVSNGLTLSVTPVKPPVPLVPLAPLVPLVPLVPLLPPALANAKLAVAYILPLPLVVKKLLDVNAAWYVRLLPVIINFLTVLEPS